MQIIIKSRKAGDCFGLSADIEGVEGTGWLETTCFHRGNYSIVPHDIHGHGHSNSSENKRIDNEIEHKPHRLGLDPVGYR